MRIATDFSSLRAAVELENCWNLPLGLYKKKYVLNNHEGTIDEIGYEDVPNLPCCVVLKSRH